jgi:hypothetical protein
MATLLWDTQDQGLHGQCFLEVFLNPTNGFSEATKMALYLGVVGCGINPQTKMRQHNPYYIK